MRTATEKINDWRRREQRRFILPVLFPPWTEHAPDGYWDWAKPCPKPSPAAPDIIAAMNATIKTDHRAKIFAICKQRAEAANACVNAMAPLHEAWKAIRDDCHGARAILDDPTALQIRFEPCGGPAFIWRARFDSVENAVVYSLVQGAEQTFFLTAAAMLDAFYVSLADYGGLTIFS